MFVTFAIVVMNIALLDFPAPVTCQPVVCPDSRPPFRSSRGAAADFCGYREYGCCTDSEDAAVRDQYFRIRRVFLRRSIGCGSYVIPLMCQKCSPFAGHLFDASSTSVIPKICGDVCRGLHRICSDAFEIVISMTNNDQELIQSLSSADQFCEKMKPTDAKQELCAPNLSGQGMNGRTSRCICVETVADNLRNPLAFRHANDGSGRYFVAEQLGIVHVFLKDGTRLEEPLLNISRGMVITARVGDERGFLGLEFHPNFTSNGKFYVFYCTPSSTPLIRFKTRISEFTVLPDNNHKADPNSERIIIEMDQPFGNHNGGELLFGDDGYLYIFVGDGGSGGDPMDNGQNKSRLLGKVLRLDVNTFNSTHPYAIPPDNPFVNEEDARPEIYAFGIRNIWRCGKDRGDRITGADKGRIICGDVGQGRFEELDLMKKGGNYGWNGREGFNCFDFLTCIGLGPEELPIHAYNRAAGQSVVGGKFYRGCDSPNLSGYFLYGDYRNGAMFKIKQDASDAWVNEMMELCAPEMCPAGLQARTEQFILTFGQDEDGEMYVLSTDRASSVSPGGKIHKIVDPKLRGNPDVCSSIAETMD